METSVFIQTNDPQNLNRASISEKPLLRSSTSSNPKNTSSMVCSYQASKAVGVAVAIALVLIVIVIVFVVAFVVSPSPSPNVCEIHRNNLTNVSTSSSPHHEECSRKLEFFNGCHPEHRVWFLINKNSNYFHSAKRFLPDFHNKSYSSFLISPAHRLKGEACSLRFSLNVSRNKIVSAYILVEGKHYEINMSNDTCHYGEISDRSILSRLTVPFHFVVVIGSELSFDVEAYGSVSTHRCTEFLNFNSASNTKKTLNPSFVTLKQGVRNLCSSEIYQRGEIDCDWMGIENLGNSSFQRIDYHHCAEMGVSHRKYDGMVWFFGFSTINSTRNAYFISPMIKTDEASHFVLSFFYRSQCNESWIRIYLLNSWKDIQGGIPNNLKYIREINQTSKNFNTQFKSFWKLAYYDIEIPESYKTVQILIEGICKPTTCNPVVAKERSRIRECFKYKCRGTGTYETFLGIDELSLERRYPQCRPSNESQLANISCTFEEGSDQNATTCNWNSTVSRFGGGGPIKEIGHWKPINEPDPFTPKFLATPKHFNGRGHILHFDASGKYKTVTHWFRSPVVIGNSNCSCVLSFYYLLYSIFAPKLSINIVVGSDVSNLLRPTISQWSVNGNQNDTWVLASVPVNIRSVPFQFEVRVTEVKDSKTDVFVDDLTFTGCDISYYRDN